MSSKHIEALSLAMDAIRREAAGTSANVALIEIAQALVDLVCLQEERLSSQFVLTSKRQADGSLTMHVHRAPAPPRRTNSQGGAA